MFHNPSSSNIHSFEDPSLSSHIQTIHVQTKNLPRLKYSLTCLSNSLAYNDSNRLYNIASISKPVHFKRIVSLLVNYQDQKIIQESLSILNILLNQGNDLTIQQENQIMHSLTYVKVDNQNDDGYVSDKFVQETLYLTYKLKTKRELSRFLSTLMSEKMTALQAKKFIKDLKRQQLKNISISDLTNIGLKFKTNVLLMNQILNLIFQKVFSGKDQYQLSKLFDFLPQIVEENIDEETISYKCLQIYKIAKKYNPQLKIDPLISKYLQSMLKYKKSLFLPLKRQFVSTEEEFLKIIQNGDQFEIYHLLLIQYLVRNGYRGGNQKWKQVLRSTQGKKNKKLREICLRIGKQQKYISGQIKSEIKQSEELQAFRLLPIQSLLYKSSILQKLLTEPSISNSLHVINQLCYMRNSQELLLTIHRIALKQKQYHLVEQIQKLVKQSYNQEFLFEKLKNITKVKHKIVLKGQLYFIWIEILIKDQQKLKDLEKELSEIMTYDSIEIEDKFYVMEFLIQNKMDKVVTQFLLYLNRQLQSVNNMEENSSNEAQIIFSEIKHYLKKWSRKLKNNTEILDYYLNKIGYHLERTVDLLFSKLVEFKSQSISSLLFQLQDWNFFSQKWRQPYRWIITSLEQISQHYSLFTLDCLELFEIAIENISQNHIPSVAKERFIKIVKKNWSKFDSEHLFTIERIMNILWQNHQYPILQQLQPIKPILQLIDEQKKFNLKNEYFFQSEHPTSNYLSNLQMSLFFGVISQQEFVKHIIQLYDKRFTDVKRFTQKNVISLMNFIIWVYQYSEEDMDKGLCDMILAFLSYKAQGSNEISSYNIRKKCIEIVAVVSHSINLLKLPLKELLETYVCEASVMKNLNEIIQTVIQSKPVFISQLGLENIVESIMISLITCENLNLIQEYIDFIQQICYIQNSNYALMFQDSSQTLYQVLKIEYKVIEKYRKNLVLFVMDILRHYEFRIQNQLLWFLMSKYFVEEDLQLCILQTLIKNLEQAKTKYILKYSHEKLLFRLTMHHNSNPEVIKMIQQFLNRSQKQESSYISESQQNTQYQAPLIVISPEDDFIKCFKDQNFQNCQDILPQIRNPFIKLQKDQLKRFLVCKDLGLYQNLLNFLINNPSTRTQILSLEEFYIRIQSIPTILKISETMDWSQQNLEKYTPRNFDQSNILIQLQANHTHQVVKSTVQRLFSTQKVKNNIIFIMKSLKTPQIQIQILAFYSKCISQTKNRVLFEIINDLKLQEGVQLMKLHLSYKVSNLLQGQSDSLIYHLFVHVQNLPFLNSPQMLNQQRYIKDISSLLCSHELHKTLPSINLLFIHLSSILEHKIASKNILRYLSQISHQYFSIFDKQENSNSKNIQIKQPQYLGLISALLFLYKNGQNIYVGLPSKILTLFVNKASSNQIIQKAYKHLISNRFIFQQLYRQKNPEQTSQASTLTQKIKEKQKSQPVVFAKQSKKQEEIQVNTKKEVNEAFQKGKQLEEYMSVVPRQAKAPAQKGQSQKETAKSIQSVEMSIQLADQQKLIRPKAESFDEKNFYEVKPLDLSKKQYSEKQRRQILQKIKLKQNQAISIATLKQHSKFISCLLDYNSLRKEQLEELMKSIDNITSTVNEHHYYVKKLIQLQVTYKLIKLYKRKDNFIPLDLDHFADIFQTKLLTLHHAMSFKKEKKTLAFDDELTIEFFKLIIKKSLNLRKSRNENTLIIEIVNYCIRSIDTYFKHGLISMFIELINMDINADDALKFFCKIQLNKHMIFQIYQRGLLNKFCQVFNSKQAFLQTGVLNRWIKLAGKICTTGAIQQKYLEKKIHKLVWEKHNQYMKENIESKKNIAFFFACLARKNSRVFEYLVQNQILQKLLIGLQNQNTDELYMLFYQVVLENINALQYCFRIKYHLHLIEKLSKPEERVKSKYFFKSLGQLMSVKQHQSLFFKEDVIKKLVQQYEVKPEPTIYECLLDFILTLDNDKQFELLKKQQFWNCLGLFEYKLSNEATYAYILQIFLVMIKKGKIKEFNTPDVRGKVTLKAEYSINLQGKQLALRFITALSIRTKQCYVTQRCIRLLSSLVGFKVSTTQLEIIEDILEVEGMKNNFEFFLYCHDYEITKNICNRFKTFNESELLSALKILNTIGKEQKNNRILRDKLLMPVMQMLKSSLEKPLNKKVELQLFIILRLIVLFKQNGQVAKRLQLGDFLVQILDNILQRDEQSRNKILDQYVTIIDISRQNDMIPLVDLQRIFKKLKTLGRQVGLVSKIKENLKGQVDNQSAKVLNQMATGICVKMYKNDGSSSELILYLSDDKLELNCVVQKGQPIKQKWRIVLSEIFQIITYKDDKQYEKSAFQQSGGIFSKPPDRKFCLTLKSKTNEFNILFPTEEGKKSWKASIDFAIQNSKRILKQFK